MISATDTGSRTLQSLAKAHRFNNWIYDILKPWIKDPVLELGSGTGNISSHLLLRHTDVSLSDVNTDYTNYLSFQFQDHHSLSNVYTLDLIHPGFELEYKHLLGSFNTLIAINVIEHIKEDHKAIRNALKLLRPGGNFIMLVPAIPHLFNELDKQLDHYRRYSTTQIDHCFQEQPGELIKKSHFNILGALGWYITGSCLRYQAIKPWQIKVFEYFVPISRWIENCFRIKFGLSILAVFKKEAYS